MKMIKVAISMLLIFCTFFCSGVSVFATEPTTPTADGGLTEYDGSLITYDYVKKNPKLFEAYSGIKSFDFTDLNASMLKHFGQWLSSGRSESCSVGLYKLIYEDMYKFSTPVIGNGKYIYFVAESLKGDYFKKSIIFSETPAVVIDNYLCFEKKGVLGFQQDSRSNSWSAGLSGMAGAMSDGKEYQVFQSPYFTDLNSNGGFISIVYPIEGNIDTILDGGSNTIPGTGGLSEKGYRAQRVLEQCSKYKADNYPKANPLEKFSDWILDPQTAYNKDDTILSGGKNAFRGFYFNPIISPNNSGYKIEVLGKKRYTYHLQLWDGSKWKQKTIWSSYIMLFSGGIQKGDYVVAPKFIMQKTNFGIVYDYETKTMTAINVDNMFTNGSVNNSEPYTVSSDNFYILNDDVAILYDKDTANLGSDVRM